VLAPRQALRDLLDELREFVSEPSRDELSDIAFGLGRLLGALSRRVYVPVWGAADHVTKIADRMNTYGCVRSRRHLINDACPSTTT